MANAIGSVSGNGTVGRVAGPSGGTPVGTVAPGDNVGVTPYGTLTLAPNGSYPTLYNVTTLALAGFQGTFLADGGAGGFPLVSDVGSNTNDSRTIYLSDGHTTTWRDMSLNWPMSLPFTFWNCA